MEITQKVEEVLNVVKSQADQIDELRGALEAVKSAPVAQVEVKDEAAELKAKFYNVAKTGEGFGTELVREGEIKSASFNVTDPASAGAGVVTEVSRQILTRIVEDYKIPSMFGIETASSTKYEKRVQVGVSGARWEGENVAAANGDHTGTPTLATIKMTHGKAIAKPVVTQEALSDPFFNAEAFLMSDVQKQLGRLICEGLLNGEGDNQPKGFYKHFDAVEGAKDVATRKVDMFPVITDAIGTDEELIAALQAMQFALKTGYVAGAKYVMNREVFQRVASLKDGMGRPMMQPSLDADYAGRIFGFEIVVDAMASKEIPVVFGKLDEAFKVVNIPTSMDFIRNPYKIDFCVEFTIAQRIGTIVGDNEAVVALIPAAARKAK
ncbi:MAG: phage major capsid protein [Aeromonas sp.]